MTTLDTLTHALEAHGCTPRNGMAKCPAHEDNKPSLAISQGNVGAIFKCFAGCDASSILSAVGLKWADVFDAPLEPIGGDRYYPYVDENGVPIYRVVRGDNKRFWQQRRHGDAWVSDMHGVTKTIYRLPAVLAASSTGLEVWVVEGEKDADRLAALDVVATTNSGGAGQWRRGFAQHFKGASCVHVIADRDTPGRKHALEVAASLAGVAPVRLWEAAEGKDVSDHLAAGLGLAELVSLDTEKPANPFIAALLDEAGLAELEPPSPLVEDWLHLHSLAFLLGPPKKGKTFVALDIAMSVACGVEWFGGTEVTQGKVLYILGEGVAGVGRRVEAWREAHPEAGVAAIEFLPIPTQLRDEQHLAWILEMVEDRQPVLLVLDTLARSIVGVEENSARDIGEAVSALDAIKAQSRACVLVVHHTGKDATRGARGSSALGGAWDSAMVLAVDEDGRTTLTNTDQKEAESGQQIGVTFDQVMRSIVPRRTDVAPTVGRDPVAVARQTLITASRRFRTDKPLSLESWVARGSGRKEHLRAAFHELVDDGMIVEVSVEKANARGQMRTTTGYLPSDLMKEKTL